MPNEEREDPKRKAIQFYFSAARKNERARLWFVVAGGLITGEPITPGEYTAAQVGQSAPVSTDDGEIGVLLPLINIEFTTGNHVNVFPLGLLDIDTVSAWGAYGRS